MAHKDELLAKLKAASELLTRARDELYSGQIVIGIGSVVDGAMKLHEAIRLLEDREAGQ